MVIRPQSKYRQSLVGRAIHYITFFKISIFLMMLSVMCISVEAHFSLWILGERIQEKATYS